ncbi:DUF397 domain-containing protein [Streptomyces sp. SID5474]|nr:DUF397 domain-containing protein [Streptomyces sp. SID5474]
MDARGRWITSSHSGGENCVEVAVLETAVGVRDSKIADSPVIAVSPTSWACLTELAGR